MTPRARSTPRTNMERAAARQARDLGTRLGAELRSAREDAGVSLSRLATACGLSKGHLHRIEAGTSQPGWETLALLCAALGRRPHLTLYPANDPLIRDHISAAMIGAVLRILHARWRPQLEVPVYRPVRGSVDLVLEDTAGTLVVACEAQSELRRIEQQLRWSKAKADALALGRGAVGVEPTSPVVHRLLLLRSTTKTRAVVGTNAEIVGAAYPAKTADALASLTRGADWPGDALLWCRVQNGRAELLERPPRGVGMGR